MATEAVRAMSVNMAVTEDDAVAFVLAHPPEVIMDVDSMTGGSGPDAIKRIIVALGELPVMFVTSEPRALAQSPRMRVLHKPVDDRALSATFRPIAPL